MMNTFWLLVKKEMIDNRKPLLLGLVGIWASYILLGAFLGNLGKENLDDLGMELFLFLFAANIIVAVAASLSFSNMKTKEDRINTLMLPATIAQKFFVRWFATVPLFLVVLSLGLLLGEVARELVEYINGNSVTSVFEYLEQAKHVHYDEMALITCLILSGILCTQAAYFLGSILWPKLSFIKTLAAMQIIQLIFGFFLFLVPWRIWKIIDLDIELNGILWFSYIFDVIFCVVMYWLAYMRFKKSQVIYKLF